MKIENATKTANVAYANNAKPTAFFVQLITTERYISTYFE